jgi:TusA-related sulfurtransferase
MPDGNARKQALAVATETDPPSREETMDEKADVTIDVSGLPCPAPLLGAKQIIDDLMSGQSLCLISDCSATRDDLEAWCRYTGNMLLAATRRDDGKTAYLLYKSGGERTTPVPHATLDMRGVACPGPVVQARKLLEAMREGEVLHLITDCTAAIDDISAWSRATTIEFLLALEQPNGVQEFYLRKR